MLNIAVQAPIPSPSVTTAAIASAGSRASRRIASRSSLRMSPSHCRQQRSALLLLRCCLLAELGLQRLHRLLHLGIAPLDEVGRSVVDVDVPGHAVVLHVLAGHG